MSELEPSAKKEAIRGTVWVQHGEGDTSLTAEQTVSRSPSEVFRFFADAGNLERLTPPFLRFRIRSMTSPIVSCDTEITYRLRLHGVPIGWRSLIAEWDPDRGFADLQLRGPFRRWHHRHDFLPTSGGTLIRDRVRFALYGGQFLPRVATRWVERDLIRIFTYRQTAITTIFPDGALDRETVRA